MDHSLQFISSCVLDELVEEISANTGSRMYCVSRNRTVLRPAFTNILKACSAGFVAKRDVIWVFVVDFFVGSGHRVCISVGNGEFFIQ